MPKSFNAQVMDVLWSGKPEDQKLDDLMKLSEQIADVEPSPEVKALFNVVMHLRSQIPTPPPAVVEHAEEHRDAA